MSASGPGAERRSPADFLRHLADGIAAGTVELPAFPSVVIRVREILKNPNFTAQMLAKPISADPTLAARLLNMANSTAFNATGRVIIDLGVALTRLGTQKVYSVVLAHAIQDIRKSEILRSIGRPIDELWTESVAVAHFCDAIAKRLKLSTADAFGAGLLHRIGHLYILVQSVERGPTRPRVVIGYDLLDKWHPQIGKAILKNWRMSEAICNAVGEQTEVVAVRSGPPTLTEILLASIRMARRMRNPHETTSLSSGGLLLRLNLSMDECNSLIANAEPDVRALERVLHA